MFSVTSSLMYMKPDTNYDLRLSWSKMPASCAAYGCTNRRTAASVIQFFRFPLKESERLAKWVRAMRRLNFHPTSASRLCSKHFREFDYAIRPGARIRYLNTTAVPSVFPAFPLSMQGKPVKPRRAPGKRLYYKSEKDPVLKSTHSSKKCHFDHSYCRNLISSSATTEMLKANSQSSSSTATTEIVKASPQSSSSTTTTEIRKAIPQSCSSTGTTEMLKANSTSSSSTATSEILKASPQSSSSTTTTEILKASPQSSSSTATTEILKASPQSSSGTATTEILKASPQSSSSTGTTEMLKANSQSSSSTVTTEILKASPQSSPSTATTEMLKASSQSSSSTATTEIMNVESQPSSNTETQTSGTQPSTSHTVIQSLVPFSFNHSMFVPNQYATPERKRIKKLVKKVMVLQQRVRRQNGKIRTLANLIKQLKAEKSSRQDGLYSNI